MTIVIAIAVIGMLVVVVLHFGLAKIEEAIGIHADRSAIAQHQIANVIKPPPQSSASITLSSGVVPINAISVGGGKNDVGYVTGDLLQTDILNQLAVLGLPQWTATQPDVDAFKALPTNQQAFLRFHAKTWNDTGAYTLGSAISTTQQIYAANPPGTPGLI